MRPFATVLMLTLSLGAASAHGLDRGKLIEQPHPGDVRSHWYRSFQVDGLSVLAVELQIWNGYEWVIVGSDDATNFLAGKKPHRGRRE